MDHLHGKRCAADALSPAMRMKKKVVSLLDAVVPTIHSSCASFQGHPGGPPRGRRVSSDDDDGSRDENQNMLATSGSAGGPAGGGQASLEHDKGWVGGRVSGSGSRKTVPNSLTHLLCT